MTQPTCPYCNKQAQLVDGFYLYGGRRHDLSDKKFWLCTPCDAWVSCHPGTTTPMGTLANAQLRRARTQAHAAFDILWHAKMRKEGCSRSVARGAGYAWLSKQLGVPPEQCHIGMMDAFGCQRVVEVCKAIKVHA